MSDRTFCFLLSAQTASRIVLAAMAPAFIFRENIFRSQVLSICCTAAAYAGYPISGAFSILFQEPLLHEFRVHTEKREFSGSQQRFILP